MSILGTLRALIRDELARVRLPEIGVVTEIFAREAEANDANHQVSVKLRASGVELPRVSVLTQRLGLSALPKVGDLVLVAFADGALNGPVVLGCLYDDQQHPPIATPEEVVYQPPEGKDPSLRRLHLELASGGTLTVQDELVTVDMGGTKVEINQAGDVEITSQATLKLDAQADLEISAGGNIKIAAQGDVSLAGMAVAVEGKAESQIKAPQIKLAGMTDFSPA